MFPTFRKLMVLAPVVGALTACGLAENSRSADEVSGVQPGSLEVTKPANCHGFEVSYLQAESQAAQAEGLKVSGAGRSVDATVYSVAGCAGATPSLLDFVQHKIEDGNFGVPPVATGATGTEVQQLLSSFDAQPLLTAVQQLV